MTNTGEHPTAARFIPMGPARTPTLLVQGLEFFSFNNVETHPDPWAQEIARILLPLPNFNPNPNDSFECYENRAWVDRLCILDWLIKCKWDSTRKPRFSRKNRLFQPQGEFWKTVVNLCMECHSRDISYPDAANWFAEIFCEGQLGGQSTNSGKDIDIRRFQGENSALTNWDEFQNPFSGEATRKLINVAMEKAEYQDIFCKERYKPFLKARSDLVILYRSSEFVAVREFNGELFTTISSRAKKGNKTYKKIGVA